jgi:hypothetical protein
LPNNGFEPKHVAILNNKVICYVNKEKCWTGQQYSWSCVVNNWNFPYQNIREKRMLALNFGFKATWLWKFTQESNSSLVTTAASYDVNKHNEENMLVRCSWNAAFDASCSTRRRDWNLQNGFIQLHNAD